MKKYRLRVDSPQYPKGTEARQTNAGYYVIDCDDGGLNTQATLTPMQVENRPTVWELVEDITVNADGTATHNSFSKISGPCMTIKEGIEEIKEEQKEKWCLWADGEITQLEVLEGTNERLAGNIFSSKELAEAELALRKLIQNRWIPKNYEEYFFVEVGLSPMMFFTQIGIWLHPRSPNNKEHFLLGNVHRSRADAEAYGKELEKILNVLLNNK